MGESLSDSWVKTLNNMGYMSLSIDPMTEKFLAYCESNPNSKVFEGGAAYGIATHLALERGAKVTANDCSDLHLAALLKETPQRYLHALELAPGKLPYDLAFPPSTFDIIYSSRMLHFLTGNEVKACMRQFYEWLKEGGKIFLIVESPYLECYAPFIPTYEERKRKGDPWPGLLVDTSAFKSIRYNNIPNLLNFFDPEIMRREALHAGFLVEECRFINREDFPPEVKYDGRESVGLIARKPSTSL